MSLLDKARAAAVDVSTKAREGARDVQAKHELGQAYTELGKLAFDLVEKGELSHPAFTDELERIRTLRAELADEA